MVYDIGSETVFGNRRLRLSTITNIRWLATLGQLSAVAFVALVLQFQLPIIACIALIVFSALLNLVLTWFFPANKRLSPAGVFAVLLFDVAQLAGLLALTGGLTNPFCVLLVVPVIISATTLPPRYTALLGTATLAFASALVFVHVPLPWYPEIKLDIPLVYVAGMWVAVVSMLVFTALYVYRVAEEARRLSDALAATELVLQREQHFSALDGLAAAAAHELGTPLATISLVAKEMGREPIDPESLREDIALLRTQSDRCREILKRLSTLGTGEEDHMARMALRTMVEEVVAPHREFGVHISSLMEDTEGSEPIFRRNPGIIYGLGNLVENAVDFAENAVELRLSWTPQTVRIRIVDDGPGFPPEVLERIGEPDLPLSRVSESARRGGGGLGLGVFIAKTLLERSGATVRFSNAFGAGKGADVMVEWPRQAMQLGGMRGENLYELQELRVRIMEDATDLGPDRRLLIVDDDRMFLQRLGRAMESRGFEVTLAETIMDGLAEVKKEPPAYAVVDMRLGDGNGLDVIEAIRVRRPDARAIVLTGYGNIATAVTAVKLGAVDYLAKPADADEVYAALTTLTGEKTPPPENPMSADRVRWEHIQRVFEMCDRNVSETARRLNMHRRTLQRILAKRAPR